jgi:peptidyl-prolyl cis-trans isomerase C
MKYLLLLAGFAAAWGQAPKFETPSAADPVVMTVGTENITKSQFEQILSSLPEQQRAMAQTPAGKKRIAEQLSELKTLAQEARARKLDQSAKVKAQIALQAENILAQSAYQELAESSKPDDAAMHAYYDAHKQEYEQVKAKHILIRFQGSQVPLKPNQKDLTEAEALAKATDLRTKILAGEDFAKLAKAESDDTGTGANGGDLGEFGKGRMVKEFEQAAFSATPGKVTEPVKSPFGYHLILVETHASKTFDQVRPEIEGKIKPDMAKKGLDDLKSKTKITFDEAYFGKN